MRFLNLTGRELKLFYLTLAVLIAWFGQRYFAGPAWTRWQGLEEEIHAKELKLEKSERLIKKGASFAKDYEGFESSFRMSGSKEEEMAKFLTEIESLAKSSAVRVTQIKPLPERKSGLYEKFYAELELEGEMSGVSRYMLEVENSPSLLTIEKLSITAKQGGNGLLKCRAVVSKISIPY